MIVSHHRHDALRGNPKSRSDEREAIPSKTNKTKDTTCIAMNGSDLANGLYTPHDTDISREW